MAANEVRVVLLEDSKDFSATIERVLEEDETNRFRVSHFDNAETALLAVQTLSMVDLFIVDLKLTSETSGYDFLRDVQEQGLFPNAPRMILSDLSKESVSLGGRTFTLDNLREVGVTEYVEKRAVWLQPGGQGLIERVNALIAAPAKPIALIGPNDTHFAVFQSGVWLTMAGGGLSVAASLVERPVFLNGSLGILALGATMVGISVAVARSAKA